MSDWMLAAARSWWRWTESMSIQVAHFRMQSSGSGTDVEMTFDVTPLTTPAKVMGFLMRPLMKSCLKETAKDLDDLAAAVEGRSPVAQASGA